MTKNKLAYGLLTAGILFCQMAYAADATANIGKAGGQIKTSNSEQGKSSKSNWSPVSFSADLRPFSYAYVSGDADKYRAMNWQNDGALYGVDHYEITDGNKSDVYFTSEGRDIIRNGEYQHEAKVTKAGLGYVEVDFNQFRKYYDGTGGVAHNFSNIPWVELDRDLHLDIGKFGVEAGLRMDDLPEVTLGYEHEYREGAKSRLTWASVTDSGIARKISPSWQELQEAADIFEIGVEHTVAGYDITSETRFENISIESRRYERQFTTGASGDNDKVRVQDQEPDSFYAGTGFRVDKWAFEDKVHGSAGYHYQHVKTTEWENMKDYSATGAPSCFTTNCENKFGAYSHAEKGIHDYILNFDYLPTKDIQVDAKLKFGVEGRESHSDYPGDTTVGFDSIINRIDKSYTEEYSNSFGEVIGVRYKGIKNVAMFSELELEQIKDRVMEDRDSIGVQTAGSANEVFTRETRVTPLTRAWTSGFNYSPSYQFSVIPQLRLVHIDEDYDDLRETQSTATGAKSAFMDGVRQEQAEFSTRVNYRPTGWLQTGFKYQVFDRDFITHVEGEGKQETQDLTNVYSFDAFVYPRKDLTLSSMLSLYDSASETPSPNRTNSLANSKSDVASWILGADYYPIESLDISQNFYYSFANNFQDISDYSVAYGAAFDRIGYTFKLMYKLTENLKLGPVYIFDRYAPNADWDTSKYKSHLLGMDVSYVWA